MLVKSLRNIPLKDENKKEGLNNTAKILGEIRGQMAVLRPHAENSEATKALEEEILKKLGGIIEDNDVKKEIAQPFAMALEYVRPFLQKPSQEVSVVLTEPPSVGKSQSSSVSEEPPPLPPRTQVEKRSLPPLPQTHMGEVGEGVVPPKAERPTVPSSQTPRAGAGAKKGSG